MLDLVQLASFAAVAERGTVAAAAAARGYTAPAVSQHLAKLEAELGAPLFDRVGGRLALTPAGEALLPLAFELLDLDTRARAAVAAPTARPRVVVAGFASAVRTVLIPRLGELQELAEVEVVEAEDAEALRELGLGTVDVVLTQEYDGEPAGLPRRFRSTPLVRDRLVLVLPPHLPTSTRLHQVGALPWLLNGRATRCAAATRRILDAAGIAPAVVATVADNGALLALVAAGLGATVVPALVLDEEARGRVTVSDHDLGVGRTILAVTRVATSPALVPVLDLLSRDAAPTRQRRAARR